MNIRPHTGEVALVTGANKGIGREIAWRLSVEGMTVYLGARDESRGKAAAAELAKDGGDVRFVLLDVTDAAQVQAAADRVAEESQRLDALVNNAGVVSEWGTEVPDVSVDQMRRTYEVNVFGVVAVTRAFLPLLRRSQAPRVVNVSSPLGSLQLMSDPGSLVASRGMLAYGSSKTALNSITKLYSNALRGEGIRVNAVNPGYVATDLNDHRGVLTVAQGAEIPVKMALLRGGGPTGVFVGVTDGVDHVLPW
ncbi:MAG: SDR family oxidoreductase [Stackebrandtia sp.]